eukprot:COSAG01_NODE_32706_length_577_cov_0.728033_1_plen_46_part_00
MGGGSWMAEGGGGARVMGGAVGALLVVVHVAVGCGVDAVVGVAAE